MVIEKQLKEWKKEGTVIEVPFEDGKSVFFRQPKRKEMKLIFAKGGQGGPMSMTDAYIKNCFLGSEDLTKEFLLSDDGLPYHSQLTASIDDLLNTKKVEIKKH